MGRILDLFGWGGRRWEAVAICCNCGKPIFENEPLVTIVAAPFARLQAHQRCHLGSAQDAALERPAE